MSDHDRIARGRWVPLSVNFLQDPAIRRLPQAAELAYLRGLVLAKRADAGGVLGIDDLRLVARGLRKFSALRGVLVQHRLWENTQNPDEIRIRSWEKYNPPPGAAERVKAQDRARKRAARAKGNPVNGVDVSGRTSERTRESLERESPSDSNSQVRSSPPGAGSATRRAEGASPRRPGQPPSPRVVSELDEARRLIAESRTRIPGAGRKVEFRRSAKPDVSDYTKAMERINAKLASLADDEATK